MPPGSRMSTSRAAAVVPPGEVTFWRSVAGGSSLWKRSSPAPVTVAGRPVGVAYLNAYLSDRFAVMPVAGAPTDAEAVERMAAALPGKEVVAVPGATIAFGGGGPHCITQQVPRVG